MRRAIKKRSGSALILVPAIMVLLSTTSHAQDEDCLMGLGGDSRVADVIVCLKKEIQKVRAARIPSGAVVAFDGQCPEELGWKPYEPGIGRFIIGAGTPSHPKHEKWKRRLPSGGFEEVQLSSYRLSAGGGEEEVTLTEEEMPSHAHQSGLLSSGKYLNPNKGSNALRMQYKDNGSGNAFFQTDAKGKGKSHNNMPPFIALYFCKKG